MSEEEGYVEDDGDSTGTPKHQPEMTEERRRKLREIEVASLLLFFFDNTGRNNCFTALTCNCHPHHNVCIITFYGNLKHEQQVMEETKRLYRKIEFTLSHANFIKIHLFISVFIEDIF